MKRRVLKAFVSTMVAASLLSQTAMAAVVSEEIPGSVSGETSSENISGSEEMQTEPIPEQPGEVGEKTICRDCTRGGTGKSSGVRSR